MKTSSTDRQQKALEAARLQRSKQTDGFEASKGSTTAGAALDRRAQRNLSNLAGASNFSSSNLPKVGGAMTRQSTPVAKAAGPDPVDVQAEIQDGLITRTDALTAANDAVQESETKLAEHLTHLKDVLPPDQLQAYADDYRQDHAALYETAETAAADLARYLTENAAPLAEAEAQIAAENRIPAIYQADITTEYVEKAAAELDTAVTQSPTGSPSLQDALSALGHTATAGENVGAALSGVGGRLGELAERAGKAFGGAGAAFDIASNLDRIVEDGGRVEHWAGVAANAVVLAEIAGVTVSAPVSMIAGAVALAAGGVSEYRDNEARVADMSGRLAELGFDEAQAERISRSNPAALRVLGEAGYSADQLQQLIAQDGLTLVNGNHTEAEYFVSAMQMLGVSPADATQLLVEAGTQGSKLVGHVANARVTSERTREDLLRALRVPYPGTEAIRELLFQTLG